MSRDFWPRSFRRSFVLIQTVLILFHLVPLVLWHCMLGVRKSIRPVKIGVIRCWCGYLSGARCRLFAYGPASATAVPKLNRLLPHLKSDWFYLSGTGLPRLACVAKRRWWLGEEMYGVWSWGSKTKEDLEREVVREDCQARKMNKEDAVDRCKWRKLIKDVWWSGWVWVGECFFWHRSTRVVPGQRPLCVCL